MVKINTDDYIHIPAWLMTELKLNGNELLIAAVIHSFSRNGQGKFYGSSAYLSGLLNISSQTVFSTLQKLTQKNIILKTERYTNNMKVCEYSFNFDKRNKIGEPHPETAESLFPDVYRETPTAETSSGIVKAETTPPVKNDCRAFVDFFNEFAKKYGFKTVREISETRCKKVKKILTDYPPETIKEVFQNIRDSDFLRGSKGWRLTFDFLIEKSNFIKILEGAYSGKKTSSIEKMVNNLDLSADVAELETF